MFLRLLLLLLLVANPVFSQQKLLRFVEAGTGKPVIDAYVYADTAYVASTNYNGNVKADINGNFSGLRVSHVNYAERVIPRDSLAVKKVYTLTKLSNVLQEVVLDSEATNDSATNPFRNFSYGMKAATRIDAPVGSTVNVLRFRVTNGVNSGVKGLNFLPFMANVYELDTLTKLPGKALLPNDVLVENKTGADWATVDISIYNIKLPPQGACVVFIIPQYDESGIYKDFWISSKYGLISAVPNLKQQPASDKNASFLYTGFTEDYVNGSSPGQRWKVVRRTKYVMEAVCADATH